MRQVTANIYEFNELTDKAKGVAIEKFRYANVEGEWWESTYSDAERIGMNIEGFDVYRRQINIAGTMSMHESINVVKRGYGESCETHKTALKFAAAWNELVEKYSDGINTNVVTEGNEWAFDAEADELEDEYWNEQGENYLSMLANEYDYLTSDEGVIETIEANEYEFTEDGSPYWG